MKLETFLLPMTMPILALGRGPALTLLGHGEPVIVATLIPATRTTTLARGSRRAADFSKERSAC